MSERQRNNFCLEFNELKKMICKDVKTFLITIVFIVIPVLIKIYWRSENLSLNIDNTIVDLINATISWKMVLSILLTGVIVSLFKLICQLGRKFACPKSGVKSVDCKNLLLHIVSVTYLERVAAFFWSTVSIGAVILLLLLFYYDSLDGEKISRTELCQIFFVYGCWFSGVNFICKYLATRIKQERDRQGQAKNDSPQLSGAIWMWVFILSILFIFIPMILGKYWKIG